MREDKIGGFNERLNSQAEARRALLEKFKPKPSVQAEVLETRAQRKVREVEEVRAKRAADKEAARLALANNEEAQLEMKRQDRKDRKAQAKAEARAKREAKSAQRRG